MDSLKKLDLRGCNIKDDLKTGVDNSGRDLARERWMNHKLERVKWL